MIVKQSELFTGRNWIGLNGRYWAVTLHFGINGPFWRWPPILFGYFLEGNIGAGCSPDLPSHSKTYTLRLIWLDVCLEVVGLRGEVNGSLRKSH